MHRGVSLRDEWSDAELAKHAESRCGGGGVAVIVGLRKLPELWKPHVSGRGFHSSLENARAWRAFSTSFRKDRRLEPGEEEKLLAVAPPHLQRLIIAALETCCRQGELLKLQWRDVSLKRGELHLRAEKTKTATTRVIPISDRLRAVLEMVKTDPSGQEFGPLAYVFGDELGHHVKGVHTAWQTAVLKAHGHEPIWVWTTHKPNGKTTSGGTLAAESRTRYRSIDLHFHDLRHEAGSRLL